VRIGGNKDYRQDGEKGSVLIEKLSISKGGESLEEGTKKV